MDLSFDANTKGVSPALSADAPCALNEVLRAATSRCGMPSPATHVSVVVVDVRQWSAWRDLAPDYLSERDRRQLARLRRADEQQWRCMGYALLRLWLSCVTGAAVDQIAVERDADGRPLLALGLGDVSLSHAGPWFAFAWSARERVGVDLETCERAIGMQGLEAYVCHPQELMSATPAGQADHAGLLRLWTRKEAALKRTGLGLSLEPRTFIAPSGTPFSLPGVEGAVEVTEFALEVSVCLSVAHAPGVEAAACWMRP